MDAFESALDQAAAIRRREVSPVDLAKMYLGRIERHNPRLNAYVLVTPELALELAEAAGLRRSSAGPLSGVTVSIKELAMLAGHRWTLGSAAFEDQVAEVDQFAVARLKEEGCVVLGKTNSSEFGSRPVTERGLFGTSRNPWHLEHTPGGSSGGAASALAAGLCSIAHGSDGGGSVRIPASCCGVVGLKPSRGRVSPGPLAGEGWAGLSTDGILARTVADAAAGLDAISGHLPGDPYWVDLDGHLLESARPFGQQLRVAFTTATDAAVDPEVAACVREVATLCEQLGHGVEEAGPDTAPFRMPMPIVAACGVASLPVRDETKLDPMNRDMRAAAAAIPAGSYVMAVEMIRRHTRQVVAFWDHHDVLVTPTLTRPAPRVETLGADPSRAGEEYLDWLSFTYPYNCTGQPAVSVPLGMSSQGLPIGIQLVGPPRGEAVILGLAAQLEEARPWAERFPPGWD